MIPINFFSFMVPIRIFLSLTFIHVSAFSALSQISAILAVLEQNRTNIFINRIFWNISKLKNWLGFIFCCLDFLLSKAQQNWINIQIWTVLFIFQIHLTRNLVRNICYKRALFLNWYDVKFRLLSLLIF